ncbi:fumarate reductase subunit C [Actinoallomurus vinaceus]|uniref:Fumarate reductase subunit C n=1 Tax=Actinoallomurus vinaceus TaxID=1080074 RepID=A0ABP8U564_9ACTN
MTDRPEYTEFHPRWYRPRMSTYWWLRRRSYLAFILRELSSVFVAWFVLYLLLLVSAVGQGATAYRRFLDWSATPWLLAVNLMAFVFIAFHAVTWFNLAPQAIVVRLRGRRVQRRRIVASIHLGWIVLSVLVIWLVMGR